MYDAMASIPNIMRALSPLSINSNHSLSLDQREIYKPHRLAIDPDRPSVLARLAGIQNSFDWDWAGAEATTEKALELDPFDSRVLGAAGSIAANLGRGEESRPNNLTYVITANGATIDNDLSIRAYFIDLATIEYSSTWNRDVQYFMKNHRMNVFADMLDILNTHDPSRFDVKPCTRCPEFETDVLQAACADIDEYTAVVEAIVSGRQSANIEEEFGKEIEETFRFELQELGINPDASSTWIRSAVVGEWVQKTFPEYRGNAMQFIRNLSKAGHTPRIHTKWTAFPKIGKDRRRGVLWLNSNDSQIVETIIVKAGRKINTVSTGMASDAGF